MASIKRKKSIDDLKKQVRRIEDLANERRRDRRYKNSDNERVASAYNTYQRYLGNILKTKSAQKQTDIMAQEGGSYRDGYEWNDRTENATYKLESRRYSQRTYMGRIGG